MIGIEHMERFTNMKMHRHGSRGFTLLEISMVIVIIGLIAGGITVGRVILAQSRLDSVMNEFAKYTSAFQQFKEKYNALPGDMANATSFWAGGSVTCLYGASTGVATCNGNGNGQIADQTNYTGGVAGNRTESHRAWQQLGFAGLIEGGYTGQFENSAPVVVTPGVRVPKTGLQSGTGWHVYYVGSQSGTATFFDGNYGHIFYLGAAVYQVAATTKGVVYSTDMITLDTKYDDGKPAYGKIRHGKYNLGTGYFGGDCVAGDTATTATYTTTLTYSSTTATSENCVPIFITGF